MFYVLAVLSFAGTVATIAFVRTGVRSRWPKVAELHLDAVALTITSIAFAASLVVHHYEVRHADQQERTVEALRKYGEAARMDIHGGTISLGSGLAQTGPLIDVLAGAWVGKQGDWRPNYNESGITAFSTVASRWPDVPWGHVGLAVCRLCRGDQTWRQPAQRAVEILRETTLLVDHVPDQDAILQSLEKWLAVRGPFQLDGPLCSPTANTTDTTPAKG